MEKPLPAEDPKLAGEVRRLVQALEASGRAALPRTSQALLESIVEAAARLFGAAAASIALLDSEELFLEFRISYGAGAEEIVGRRFPVDQGIAGYVIMTGQPIAIANVQQDPRFNQDFAASTGYVPRSILATPLVLEDRVIGVMEVLDKLTAPTFGMQDMELLGLFARQAAIAIDQSQGVEALVAAFLSGLKRLVPQNAEAAVDRLVGALSKTAGEDQDRSADLLALADYFYTIAELGEAERKTCLDILAAFQSYAYARSSRRS